eukprot:jgi/Mesen1/4472/ME000228S03455
MNPELLDLDGDATEAAPDPNVPLLPAPELVAKALVAVVAPAMAEKAGVCGRLLLAAHHPCVVAGQHKSTVWKALLKSTAKKGADMTATLASDASIILLGPGGLVSTRKEQAAAAVSAIATAMQTFPAEFFPHLFPALEALGDRTAHDELTERDIKIHFTEEGVLSTEDGVYVAEAVRDKNEPVRPSMAVSSSKTSGAGKKDAASKPGGKKSDADKAKTGKELAREEQLREEAGVRAEVIRERQALVLQALGAAAHANPFFAHDELPALVEFVLPLLKSPLVASEAYATMLQLAACVAPSLQPLSADLASALCMVVTSAAAVHGDLKPHTTETRGGAGKVRQGVVERVVLGIVASCKQGPLPAASFGAIFPILLAPSKTRVHDDLIQVIALHTSPYIALPRRRMIAVLYHVLGVVPVLYDRVLPLLRELCKGLHSDELLQALSGLYAEQAHVRAACLDAVQYVPAVGKGQVAADPALTALLWLAQYDPDKDDPKVGQIVQRLLEVLNTPSESVQRAVSNCLPPLMASRQADAQALVARLLGTMMSSDKYGERRGAAFGLAGVVKGLGLSAFKKYGIMDALKRGLEDKVSPKAREGALLGFECLCEKIGRLFEPYVIHILPLLLVCFSDAVVAVREAADGAARAIMGQLTGQGVKLVLPALLTLSQCLPTIVPNLTEVLTDTHPKVQAAAQTALQQVGSVIRNPEIASLVPSLLVGIADPNEHTRSSLDLLLQTTFVNTVDAPSLALLVPIVHRGLRERSSETKKKAAQIVGNMCSLVSDPKDMLPYRNLLLPELRKVLVDPHPEVRTVAARALGSLVRGLGQDNFQDLVPWLLTTIKSDTASVERSGAAQGLSEVVAALGKAHFEALLPDIIANCSHARASVRDGYLTLFKFLPSSLGAMFQKHLPVVLPAILDGLADENESVREAALAAGHVLVEHYATSALPLLLPAVEEGIFSDNWRIRQSSVAGTSGKVVLEGGSDDEGASTEAHGQAIINILGRERRNAVLAAVYVVRSDVSLSVRQTIVVNTPKTLKEIMPVLMSTLISALGSSSFERRQVAGRSLGELVRKLGDRVLPSIIPILARGLGSDSGATRQGVCIGLSEVMGNTGKQQLASYMPDLIPTIRNALCDSEADVREAAGQAFNTLYKNAGLQAVDEIVPALLHALEDPKLRWPCRQRGLTKGANVNGDWEGRAFNAHALGALAKVAGPGLNAHLSTVLPPFLAAVGDASEDNAELAEVARSAAETVVAAVDEDGLDALISEFMGGLSDSSPETRRGAAALLGYFCRSTRLDLEDEVPGLLSTLIILLTDPDEGVVKASWEALGSVTGTVPKENLASLLKTVRDAIGTARDRERRKRKGSPILIPGLCLPKALQPLLQVYLQGLMSGSAELREQAADGLGEIIDVTSEAALRPFVVPITGPLIRIIGDRFPWQVKSSILGTLSIIIAKGGIALKPFLPQLQTTFVKCLQDNNRLVRSRAAKALGRLTRLNPRVDPLVGDLLTAAQNAEGGVKEAMLVALKGVMQHAGKGVGVPTLLRLQAALSELLPADEDEIRALAGRALGISSQFLGDAEFESLLQGLASPGGSQAWAARHGSALALSSLLRHASVRVSSTPGLLALVQTTLKARAKDDKVPVRDCAAKGIGRLLRSQVEQRGAQAQSLAELLPVLAQLLADDASDARRRALSALKALAKVKPDVLVPYWPKLAPHVANCLKDSSQPVRMAAERTALHLFQLPKGADAVQAAQKYITGLDARRIAKLQELSDASEDSEGEGIDS